jgi:hypothetical protein
LADLPPWLLACGARSPSRVVIFFAWATQDRMADERVLQALGDFWRLFAQRYRGRNVLFACDLLNEPQVPWDAPALRSKWNVWLAARYGSAEKAGKSC